MRSLMWNWKLTTYQQWMTCVPAQAYILSFKSTTSLQYCWFVLNILFLAEDKMYRNKDYVYNKDLLDECFITLNFPLYYG